MGGSKPTMSYDGWLDTPPTPALIPKSVGHGVFEGCIPKPGMAIIRGRHNFLPERSGQLIQLTETITMLGEPAIVIQLAAAGRALVKDKVSEKDLVLSKEQPIFQRLDHISFARMHDATFSNELYYLIITISFLYSLMGEDSTHKLLAALNLSDEPSAHQFKMPHAISSIVHSSISSKLDGEFKKLYAHGKMLQYLSLLADHVLGEQMLSSTPRRTRLIRQLHEELMSLEGEVPNLTELSNKYKLSTRTLNTDFKREFGKSIYAYVKDQRLDKAHALLVETEKPMKAIAADLGYAHVTNFMLAFKKKFGYAPGSLRR